jgi:hypothetical protein
MIIVTEKYGGLSNRLYSLAPFVSFCIRNNTKLVCFSFGDYSRLFPFVNTSRNCKFIDVHPRIHAILRNNIKRRSLQKYFEKIIKAKFYTHESDVLVDSGTLVRNICFLDLWNHPKPFISVETVPEIKRIFSPSTDVVKQVECWLRSVNPLNSPILTIHARRADYKNFRDGEWYYNDSDYNRLIRESFMSVKELSGKNPIIIGCSDEKEFLSKLNCLPSPFHGPTHDQYLISKSDYILGPPSTFSHWGMFMGNGRICSVRSKDQCIMPKDFNRSIDFSYPSELLE